MYAADALARLAKERKLLESGIRSRDEAKAMAAIDAIGELESPKAVEYLLSLAKLPSSRLYTAVVEAIPGSGSEAMMDVLVTLYQQELHRQPDDWERRVMLLDVFRTVPGDHAIAVFSLAAKDRHPKVRLAAIRGLQAVTAGDRHKIPIWIESLSMSEAARDLGTPHVEARTHLFASTAKDFRDAAAWEEHWRGAKDGFESPASAPEGGIDHGSTAEYYGSTVTSRRILFIVDTSASMNTFEHEGWPNTPQVPWGTGGGVGGVDAVGSPVTEPQWRRWLDRNPLSVRMNRAKAELTRLIVQLPPDTAFNIIAFGSRPAAWQKTMMPVDQASIASATQFVSALRPSGATAADLALAMAFETSGMADTLYFLSDGEPSRDGITLLPVGPLLEHVGIANRFHRIIIHTLGFGTQGEPFMKALAERNGGQFRRVKGPPEWLPR